MKLSKEIWNYSEEYYKAISNHQFVLQLRSGKLPINSFKRFISQDILYLRVDTNVFKFASLKAANESERLFFDAVATNGILYEQMVQDELMIDFDIQPAKELETPFSDYCNHLTDSVDRGYLSGISALLPCFWYYAELGKEIQESDFIDNKYHKWLKTYSDPFFITRVEEYVELIDQIGRRISDSDAKLMMKAFKQSAIYELAVFDYSLI